MRTEAQAAGGARRIPLYEAREGQVLEGGVWLVGPLVDYPAPWIQERERVVETEGCANATALVVPALV